MTDNQIIQMHDYAGNNQYPVTLASLVYDEDGETVGKKLALLLDWFEWGDDAHSSVKTKYHFWSEKQLSAGGVGEEGGSGEGGIGTITGIKVNGEVWNEPDELGVLTIPNYPTSLEWADISGRPTHLSQFTDDVVAGHYLPTSGGTIESAGIPLTIKRTNNPYSVISFYGIEDGTSQHLGYLGFSGVGEPIYMTSGGSERILIHSGNVGSYALPIEGGTMSGAIQWASATLTASDSVSGAGLKMYAFTELEAAPANSIYHSVLSAVSSYCGLQLAVYGGENESHPFFRRVTTTGTKTWEKLAFVSDLGNYLPLTGGIMEGNIVMKKNAIVFESYQSDTWANPQNSGLRILNTVGASATEAISSYSVGLSVSGYYGFQLASDAGIGSFYYRNTVTGTNGSWKQIAFTDSDIIGYSAGLKHSNGTIGAIVNSSGNILIGTTTDNSSGKLQVDGGITLDGYMSSGSVSKIADLGHKGLVVSVDSGRTSWGMAMWTDGKGTGYIQQQSFATHSNTYSLCLNPFGGNVGIGTSNPETPLHVNGSALIGQIYIQNDNEINQYGGDLWLQYRTSLGARNVRMCYGGGGVTIGGVDVGDYAFHVAGNSRFQDSLTIGSAVLSWDSVNNALKIEGNVYTTGQLSVGGVGTEVQKVFDIAATSNTTIANQPYTAYLTHNLNTYDLAVVVYEVTLQSDGITETLTQVLADVTLTDENKVEVYFASRKIDKKYRIVIIG